ncbi:HXXEE domain-containing protein [Bacillus chungangensis]|uniref:Neutral ceramidase superfamily lipid hydrolase n=2 Tax=Bacillus chungangensis TaxID=587633 RepID=A0ABT9WW97_9BACI|nr:putative neutral ceramidase superfamily lipid hydrolase [Bacillus chungangensis]
MKSLSPYKILWLLPIIFAIHNLEELWLLEDWVKTFTNDRKFAFIKNFYRFETLAFAMILLTLAGAVIIFFAYRKQSNITFHLMILCNSLLFINSLTHLGQFFLFRKYVPGLLSAVILMMPFTFYTLFLYIKNKSITPKMAAVYLGISVLAMGPIIIIFLVISKLFT